MQLDRPLRTVTSSIDAEILALLAAADFLFSARRVHMLLGEHSESGVRKALDRLVEQGSVSMHRGGQAKLYRLNRDHLAAPYIIGLARMRDELIARLRQRFGQWSPPPVVAALFGSAGGGRMRPDSDIDLFVVRPAATAEEDGSWRTQLVELEQVVARWTGNDVRVLELGEAEAGDAAQRPESVVVDILRDGLVLCGELAFKPRRRSRRG